MVDTNHTFADSLLHPRSVAIVGASGDPAKTTSRPQRFLRKAGYAGTVHLVNPARDEVLGERCHPNLTALPEVPDHVYILTNAEPAIDTVRECARLGVPVATILASGFGEEGPEGLQRQQRLRDTAREGGVRLIGPSSLGVVNPRNNLLLTANAAFDEELLQGDLFVASQSGSIIGALVSRGKARGIGFAGLVSVGGEADISIGTLCAATVDDQGISAYALFMESLQHTDELADFAHKAHQAGKPVVVYKLGRSEEAAALSVSHTGALAGADSESDAFFRACGFARVDQLEALIEAPALLRKLPATPRKEPARVGIITTTGGGAAIMVDQLATRDVKVVAPSSTVLDRFAEAGVPVAPNLIADLTLAGAKHELVRSAIEIMQNSGEFDLVCFVIGSSARSNPELAVKAIAERAEGQVPLAAFALPDALHTLRLLDNAGVAAFRTPEACADAIAGALDRTPPTVRADTLHGAPAPTTSRILDEAESSRLLADQGITTVDSVVLDTTGTTEPDLPFDYPVAVKALSEALPHKTEAGAVALDIPDAASLRTAITRITTNVAAYDPTITLGEVLVQPMAKPGIAEALVGYRVSPAAGPIVLLAAGGIYAELYSDSTVRLAPVDTDTARDMIADVRGLGTLSGFRGADSGDIDALADTIVAISNLATDRPDVIEAEINPLTVGTPGNGAVALDALVRVTGR
ncbi:6-carboxyhexanoate--CoA ligase [Prauserella marina]|uniref:Acyl-CoA synthetase (NDP forming) n=1 Tax=Prauserella marina TaxID=530584 RepID=A0A222VQE4_9PSEU|nr:acetate--CoA ligase family protein [Prauserella marina]ASR36120.1 6-carboxyhexanoate--CoA ligase [Prauserella marina]PWV76855.1 acyl-CoA synthetase (NDP forming) [Prauserella marina]SDC99105.1 Acyl-CoA synthetase (NDP forming) [Prauserella marina]